MIWKNKINRKITEMGISEGACNLASKRLPSKEQDITCIGKIYILLFWYCIKLDNL